jgi:hypothetical protein
VQAASAVDAALVAAITSILRRLNFGMQLSTHVQDGSKAGFHNFPLEHPQV